MSITIPEGFVEVCVPVKEASKESLKNLSIRQNNLRIQMESLQKQMVEITENSNNIYNTILEYTPKLTDTQREKIQSTKISPNGDLLVVVPDPLVLVSSPRKTRSTAKTTLVDKPNDKAKQL